MRSRLEMERAQNFRASKFSKLMAPGSSHALLLENVSNPLRALVFALNSIYIFENNQNTNYSQSFSSYWSIDSQTCGLEPRPVPSLRKTKKGLKMKNTKEKQKKTKNWQKVFLQMEAFEEIFWFLWLSFLCHQNLSRCRQQLVLVEKQVWCLRKQL